MAKTKTNEIKKGKLRGAEDYDFTMSPVGFANVRFGPQMVAEIVIDLENMEAYVRVTNEIAGVVASGTATLVVEE